MRSIHKFLVNKQFRLVPVGAERLQSEYGGGKKIGGESV